MPVSTRATVIFVLSTCLFARANKTAANVLNRDSDPVIMVGTQLPALTGTAPSAIVGFRYSSGWVQIPIQVDERATKDFGAVYNQGAVGLTTLGYTDTRTFMGADPDPNFDDGDELVWMARDAGNQVPGSTADPPGTLPGTRLEIEITDPLNAQQAYAYLFETDGSLIPGAGADYVTYTFGLLSGPYLSTYNTMTGPNPENSEATTAFYRTHFADRWIRDEAEIFAGGATGVDILDRHKSLFTPGNCVRSENTFSAGEGAFFANIDGPVRAIRSYLGANSGPFTQRDHFFYERRHDIRTYLRVHAIAGIVDFYDYTPAANGMVYYNDLNLGGVTVDGSPVGDVVTPGAILWEMVTGAQGTLIHANAITTDIPGFTYTSYYEDDTTPSVTQCTGDSEAWGSSGYWITGGIPNTDPAFGVHNIFIGDRIIYAEGPNETTQLAQQRADQARNPLQTAVKVPTAIGAIGAPNYPLAQNYPNPFRASTRIEFSAPPNDRVTLRIYDVRGRLVRTLVDGTGSGSATWNRLASSGNKVASGIYFYQLHAGGKKLTRKLVVLE